MVQAATVGESTRWDWGVAREADYLDDLDGRDLPLLEFSTTSPHGTSDQGLKDINGSHMDAFVRRASIGLLAGLASSIALASTLSNSGLGIALGVLVGLGYSLAFPPTPRAYADSAMTAAALGIPLDRIREVVSQVREDCRREWTKPFTLLYFGVDFISHLLASRVGENRPRAKSPRTELHPSLEPTDHPSGCKPLGHGRH